jgi:signal transduction histidine kinase
MTQAIFAFAQAAIPTQAPAGELAAAVLQATITAGLAILCVMVWRKSREPHFAWWSVAFGLYVARIGMIIAFLTTLDRAWLFWHQVVTGWVALALLWAAFVFASRREWKAWYWLLLAFPLLWSYVAVIRLENFTLAAVPAVLFISGATLWTGIVLLRHRRPGTAPSSLLLGWTFLVWGLHHLDYPILRAQGAWLPWGYYLDIMFVLAVGAGILLLVNSDLASRLQVRTVELERLGRRMVRQHEEERRRLSLELHDETAQVFAAVKMQLGIVRERVEPAVGTHVDRALSLVDDGLRGVRNVLNDLRPGLLDDLGLLPALRSLVAEFGERHGAPVTFTAPESIPVLSDEAEVAVFRAVQEALSNVARHAERAPVRVEVTTPPGHLRLVIADEGPGFDGSAVLDRAANDGHLGIAGMRERIAALGGRVDVRSAAGSGVRIEITLATREDSA